MSGIVGILLAAGASRRFGSDKRWHRLTDGTPMALAAACRLRAAIPDCLAIIRPGDEALADLLTAAGLRPVICPAAADGMGHSLAAGVAASAEAAGWVVTLADMPDIAVASHLAVLQALVSGAPLARVRHAGQPGHPVGFSRRFREDLLALTGDQGGRTIIAAHRDELQWCPVDDPGVLRDIDHPGEGPDNGSGLS